MNVLRGKMIVPSRPHVTTPGAPIHVFACSGLLTTTQRDLGGSAKVAVKTHLYTLHVKQNIFVTSEHCLVQHLQP